GAVHHGLAGFADRSQGLAVAGPPHFDAGACFAHMLAVDEMAVGQGQAAGVEIQGWGHAAAVVLLRARAGYLRASSSNIRRIWSGASAWLPCWTASNTLRWRKWRHATGALARKAVSSA